MVGQASSRAGKKRLLTKKPKTAREDARPTTRPEALTMPGLLSFAPFAGVV